MGKKYNILATPKGLNIFRKIKLFKIQPRWGCFTCFGWELPISSGVIQIKALRAFTRLH